MPGDTAIIKADQRQAIFGLVRAHLSGLSDVCLALDRDDFATAERLALEFGEDFRLLADLGWQEDDRRESFLLTMPAEDLIETLKRLRAEATEGFTESPDERQLTEEEHEAKTRCRLVIDTCDGLMGELDSRRGESA